MSDEIWDREMTVEEFKGLDPTLQRKRIDTSLRRKVTEMKRWSEKGVPKDVDWRKKGGFRVQLRKWHDPKKKLWRWSDDAPDHPKGRNRGIMAEWKKARTLLAAGRSAKPRNELDVYKERVRSLELQNSQLIADKADLEERLRRAELKVATLLKKMERVG